MRILYGYSNCTDKKYNELMSERGASAMVPDQKYHGLLIKGLAANGAKVRCCSGLPVNRAVTSRKLIREPDEQEGGAHYHYITTLNLPVLRQFMILCGSFFTVMGEKKDKDTYAVCDCLNTAVAAGFILACRLRRIPKAAIVTDLPDMFSGSRLNKAVRNRVLRSFDGYVFLTEHMNTVNKRGKPHIVMEGHADPGAVCAEAGKRYESSDGLKVVMYAGSIQRAYGLFDMISGFLEAGLSGSELRIYGDGPDRSELEQLAAAHPGVRYMGSRPNSEIVAEEQRVALLINPRPTAGEYNKYSFPSKTIEYMASGTPVLTTRLPGIPGEYDPYLCYIGEDTADGIGEALKKVFSMPFEERCRKGAAARDFVIKNKSSTVQAKKIMDLLTTLR